MLLSRLTRWLSQQLQIALDAAKADGEAARAAGAGMAGPPGAGDDAGHPDAHHDPDRPDLSGPSTDRLALHRSQHVQWAGQGSTSTEGLWSPYRPEKRL